MAQDILKAGWLEKEFASRSWFKYRSRYVVLTTLNIKYYYQEAEAHDTTASDSARQEIPLLTVNDGSILDHGTREAEFIHIETPSRTWRFKAANAAEAEQWRQAIVAARGKLGVSRVHFGVLPAQTTKPKLEAVQEEEGDGEEEKESKLQELFQTYEQNDELLNALENITCNSVDKAKYTANLFFESVSVLPLKERANRAKEMARAMVAWVNFDDSERVGSGYDSCLKMDVYVMWVRIALSREFLASCKFEEGNKENEEDNSSESSCMTHSTIKSRMKNLKVGTVIMPFRADTAECLFISSLLHCAANMHHTLQLVLQMPLGKLASHPELYTYNKVAAAAIAASPAGTPSNHPEGKAGDEKHAPAKAGEGGKDRASARFLGGVGGMFRSVFSRNTHGHSNNSNRPASVSMEHGAARPSSALLSSYFYLLGGNRPSPASNAANTAPAPAAMGSHENPPQPPVDLPTSPSDGPAPSNNNASTSAPTPAADAPSLLMQELSLLSLSDLKRLEVRKRLHELGGEIVGRMHCIVCDPSNNNAFPLPIKLVLRAIKDLILVTKDATENASASGDAGVSPRLSVSLRRRFEYGIYFTSCTALLFLRLLCRALISPEEYGVVGGESEGKYAGESEGLANCPAFPRSLPFMTLLAHTVHTAQKKEEGNVGEAAGKKKELLENRYALEILSLSKNLAEQMPVEAAKLSLDATKHMYLSSAKPPTLPSNSDAIADYSFDFAKPTTRWALAEVAKTVQHVANISCLPKEEMQSFARDSLIRQNIQAGKQDKDSYDTYVLTGYENETINTQVEQANTLKQVYEVIGDLGTTNW